MIELKQRVLEAIVDKLGDDSRIEIRDRDYGTAVQVRIVGDREYFSIGYNPLEGPQPADDVLQNFAGHVARRLRFLS